jgi:hypothetical protein
MMPEVVTPHPVDVSHLDDGVELAPDVALVERRADA